MESSTGVKVEVANDICVFPFFGLTTTFDQILQPRGPNNILDAQTFFDYLGDKIK
jgi:hypothetical protein